MTTLVWAIQPETLRVLVNLRGRRRKGRDEGSSSAIDPSLVHLSANKNIFRLYAALNIRDLNDVLSFFSVHCGAPRTVKGVVIWNLFLFPIIISTEFYWPAACWRVSLGRSRGRLARFPETLECFNEDLPKTAPVPPTVFSWNRLPETSWILLYTTLALLVQYFFIYFYLPDKYPGPRGFLSSFSIEFEPRSSESEFSGRKKISGTSKNSQSFITLLIFFEENKNFIEVQNDNNSYHNTTTTMNISAFITSLTEVWSYDTVCCIFLNFTSTSFVIQLNLPQS